MKRSYPSGASKRKKVEDKRKKKEELPKLTAYFPIPTASSAAAQGTVPTSSATIAPILQSLDAYSVRKHENSRIDKELILQYNNEVTYWQKVLERIVAAVKFLASRGLAFR